MLTRRFIFSAFVLLGLLLLGSSFSPIAYAATTYTVNTLDDNQTSGDLFCTLREAAQDHTSDCGTDSFGPYTVNFSVSGTITLAAQLDIPAADTTIDGTGQDVVISGGGATRVLYRHFANTLTLQFLTIADGNCGGNCNGSGILNDAAGMLNVWNTTFTNNGCGFFCNGGAIYNFSTLNVVSSTFSNNGVDLFGGGIYNDGQFTNATVTGSTFHANSATTRNGGAIFNFNGSLHVINSTFNHNTALGGGAIAYEGSLGLSEVINSTIAGNSSTGINGGSIHVSFGPNTQYLRNTILADNAGGNCHADAPGSAIGATSDNISDDNSCDSATQKTTAEINLAALGNYGGPTKTMALLAGSAAIDAANDGVCNAPPVSNLDQRGVPRPVTDCDVGAFEAQAVGTIKLTKDTNPAGGYDFGFTPPHYVTVNAPGAIAGDYNGSGADFGPPLTPTGITGNLTLVNDGVAGVGVPPGTPTDGCEVPFVNAAAVAGNIAVIDRGYCLFSTKVQNAQNAGATAVIIVNISGNFLFPLSGQSGATIPTILIGNTAGTAIKAQLPVPGVNATLRASLGGVFTLDDGETQTLNDVIPGQYSFLEYFEPGVGFTINSILCDDANSTGNPATATAIMNVEPGETVTCTFTNDSAGDIVIKKVTDPPGLTDALFGTPHFLTQYTPVNSQELFDASGATFGPPFNLTGIFGDLELVNDATGVPTDACEPLVGFTAGKIALIDRGICPFALKVQNAQNAGAIAAVIANNIDDTLVVMDGAGPTIPSVFIAKTAGDALKASLSLPATVTVNLNAPMGGVFRLDDGQSKTVSFLPVDQYKVNEDATGGLNVFLDNLVCDDENSTEDIPNRIATINLEDGETVTCTFTDKQLSTAVNVAGLKGVVNQKGNLVVKWKTTNESQIAGFNVYRKTAKGEWKQINGNFKQAKNAGSVRGNKYRFTDRRVRNGKTYRYRIEVIYLDNHSEFTNVILVKTP